ncbi:hypothetical protein VTK26DRAFT_3263 [Humicola hyalothermophila]
MAASIPGQGQFPSVHTIVLHPLKNPEIESRCGLESEDPNSSYQYLRKRKGGFIFLKWFKRNEDVRVALFTTVDPPHELVVIKKLRNIPHPLQASDEEFPIPPEIEHSSVVDPLVRRRLPLLQNETPFVQLHAFQVHSLGSTSEGTLHKFDATLFYKYYNGGTLHDVLYAYSKRKKKLPEGFIWHVIAQLGRALSWLHTGILPSPAYNVMAADRLDDPDAMVNKHQGIEGWNPICHQDGHAANVWLHYPSDEEKAVDPGLEAFDDVLPQIILGDFGYAFQEQNDRDNWLQRRFVKDGDGKEGDKEDGEEKGGDQKEGGEKEGWLSMPELATLRDKADLGRNIKLMMQARKYNPNVYWDTKRPRGEPSEFGFDDVGLDDPIMAEYSDELNQCVQKFHYAIQMLEDDWYTHISTVTGNKEHWNKFPSNDFVYGHLIAVADKNVHDYRLSPDKQESMLWTRAPDICFPWRTNSRDPRTVCGDWARVMQSLELNIDASIRAVGFDRRRARGPDGLKDPSTDLYDDFPEKAVEVCRADLAGGPEVEEELAQVEFDDWRWKHRPLHVQAPTDAGELPDYEEYQQPEAEAAAAQRATILPLDLDAELFEAEEKYEAFPKPEEYRRRKEYEDRMRREISSRTARRQLRSSRKK